MVDQKSISGSVTVTDGNSTLLFETKPPGLLPPRLPAWDEESPPSRAVIVGDIVDTPVREDFADPTALLGVVVSSVVSALIGLYIAASRISRFVKRFRGK